MYVPYTIFINYFKVGIRTKVVCYDVQNSTLRECQLIYNNSEYTYLIIYDILHLKIPSETNFFRIRGSLTT